MTQDMAVLVENLSIRFGDFTAVDNISFSVKKGEIFGFLGANGAGKTTTIRMLCGLLTPSSGRAFIAGLNFDHGADEIKKKVGYMSQKFTLYPDLTVQENLEFAAALRKVDPTIFKKKINDLFNFIQFKTDTKTLVKDLPGGLKQEMSLVASLLHDPEIIFLDEPTAGVSPAARARFWDLIRILAGQGKTIFVTTHYMDEAEQCDRIALMRAGQIIALDTPSQLKEHSFPDPLVEVNVAPDTNDVWKKEFSPENGVTSLQPYGLRYHAIFKDDASWKNFQLRTFAGLTLKKIKPSLEDVFIRLVEGANR